MLVLDTLEVDLSISDFRLEAVAVLCSTTFLLVASLADFGGVGGGLFVEP